MPLAILNMYSCTSVADLSPLEGLNLTTLSIGQTKVTNLSALRGMPLKHLECYNAGQISDFSPLEDCKSLEFLLAKRTKIIRAGVAALQTALPQCKIEWDGPAPAPAGKK